MSDIILPPLALVFPTVPDHPDHSKEQKQRQRSSQVSLDGQG